MALVEDGLVFGNDGLDGWSLSGLMLDGSFEL